MSKSKDIEEDIEFLNKMIKEYKTFGDLDNPEFEDTKRIYKALENVIEEYEDLKIKNNMQIVGTMAEHKLEDLIKDGSYEGMIAEAKAILNILESEVTDEQNKIK